MAKRDTKRRGQKNKPHPYKTKKRLEIKRLLFAGRAKK